MVIPILVLILSGCRVPEISTVPDSGKDSYRSVNIRVKIVTDNGRDKTRIILGYNRLGDRLIFLGPLNQVLFEAVVTGNRAVVSVPKRKQFWQGEFRDFLMKWWGIDLTYNEIKAFLLEQRVNRRKLEKNGFSIRIIESEKKRYPVHIHLTSPEIRLEFRIYENKPKQGKLLLRRTPENYTEVSLEAMIRSSSR